MKTRSWLLYFILLILICVFLYYGDQLRWAYWITCLLTLIGIGILLRETDPLFPYHRVFQYIGGVALFYGIMDYIHLGKTTVQGYSTIPYTTVNEINNVQQIIYHTDVSPYWRWSTGFDEEKLVTLTLEVRQSLNDPWQAIYTHRIRPI